MSRVGRSPSRSPRTSRCRCRRAGVQVQGPKGQARRPAAARDQLLGGGRPAALPALERRAPAARLPRPGARAGAERADRRDPGLQQGAGHRRRRLQGRWSRATRSCSRSASRTPWSSRSRRASRSRSTSRRAWSSRASTGSASARWRRRSAAAQAGSLQAEGDPLRRRGAEEEGRQGRRHGRGEVGDAMRIKTKEDVRARLHARIRKKLAGKPERPRLAVFRSQSHIYAQVIDDEAGRTLCAASSLEKALQGRFKRGANVAAAKAVGRLIADRAKEKGVDRRRVRPRRLPVPRPRESAGRRRPRGRAEVLSEMLMKYGRRSTSAASS